MSTFELGQVNWRIQAHRANLVTRNKKIKLVTILGCFVVERKINDGWGHGGGLSTSGGALENTSESLGIPLAVFLRLSSQKKLEISLHFEF